jgi:hypothetical protein
VKREDKFVLSHHPYAVDMTSLRTKTNTRGDGTFYYWGRINAVWFRRRRSASCGPLVTVACIGHLWDYQDAEPTTAAKFLAQHDDGRYGGNCEGRWDGARYWGSQDPDEITQHLELLRPMVENYPACPDSHEGWWKF